MDSPLQAVTGNRKRGTQFTESQRIDIIEKRQDGWMIKDLAEHFRCSVSGIEQTIRRWSKHQTTKDLPRSGRPRVTTIREDRTLLRMVRKNPKVSYADLAVSLAPLPGAPQRPPLSRWTMARRLREYGVICRKAVARPKLNKGHAALRLKFCRQYRDFRWHQQVVKFSDEYTVQRGTGNTTEWVFRYPYEKYDHCMIQEKEIHKGMSQMVWAAVWLDERGCPRRSELVIMERDENSTRNGYSGESYIKTLEKGLLPHWRPT
jgi:transposase